MADNFDFTPGTGATGSADDVGGVLYPRVKLDIGTDGVGTPVVGGAGAVAAGVPRVTLASDDPAVTDLAAIEVLLTGIDADTNAIKTATELIDNTVYSEDVATPSTIVGNAIVMERDDALSTLTPVEGDWAGMRCSAEGALWVQEFNSDAILADTASMDTNLATVAGDTTSIDGKITACNTGAVVLAASDGTDIGDVDVASVVPGTTATNLGKAVDSPGGATDTGIAILAIRDDALTTLTPADGDYVNLRVNSTGALHVTGSAGSTQYVEDTAHSSGDTGTMALAVRVDSAGALAGTDGDYSPLQVDSAGALRVTGGGGGTEYNEDAATPATITGTATVMERDDVLSTLTPIEGDWAGMRCSAEGALWTQDFNSDTIMSHLADIKTAVEIIDDWDDTNYANVNLNLAGTDVTAGAGAVAAGTPRVTLASDDPAVTALQIMDDWDNGASDGASVSGDTAHDSADAGEPVKIGGKAYNQDGTAPGTAVAEGDRANFICDVYGRQFVSPHHPNLWDATDNQSTAQTNTALKAAPGAGLSLYITDIIISNGATAGNIKLVEDTGGTPVDIVEVMYFAANGGAVINLQTPIKVTANKDVGYTSVTVTTHSITLSGYIAP